MGSKNINKDKVKAAMRKNQARSIPRPAIKRIFQNKIKGDIRINNEAIEDLTRLMEIIVNRIAEESAMVTIQTKKKTLTVDEIEPATVKLLGISLKKTVTNQKVDFEYTAPEPRDVKHVVKNE